MRPLHLAMLVAIGLIAAACQPSGSVEESPGVAGPGALPFTRCSDVPLLSADPGLYRDTPIYVGNEMPADEVRAWAAGKPGFEEIWIDRDRLGWITVAFSADADARQAELAKLFPGVGVVAVEVDWTMAELEALQRRIGEALGEAMDVSTWISVQQGVVGVGVGVLEPERIAAVEQLVGDAPICIDGLDQANVPATGPQQPDGDGWRLLADEAGAGHPYRTGIAFDEDSYARLWTESGVTDPPPPVDFNSEVVVWFGAVYGLSCPDLRLDDIVVDRERAIVHAEIVHTEPATACTADANPRAYLVALERVCLPVGPFWIQLGAADPPGGVPEERTIVEVDLSAPGAVAQPEQVHPDQRVPGPQPNLSGGFIETGYEALYRMSVHCGVEWLGELNAVTWRTDVPAGSVDFIPPEWEPAVDPAEQIDLVLLMEAGPIPTITATANGHSVLYRATAEEPPGCD
jgi:hypothetical protein